MSSLFQQTSGIISIITRNIGKYKGKNVYRWQDGIKYPGFTYYPRNPDFKDPPYEATKLFRVQRTKPVKGTAFWEREILKEFHLDGLKRDVAILKNMPETNSKLWKIKHLVQISPITFPNGFPQDPDGAFLKENGELVVAKRVGFEQSLAAAEAFKKDPKKLDGDTLRRQSRHRWTTGR